MLTRNMGLTGRLPQVLVPGQGLPELYTDHPLLSDYTDPDPDPHMELRVQRAPDSRLAFMAALCEAHEEATAGEWYRISTLLNEDCRAFASSPSDGDDLLAEGPLSILEAYAEAARQHGTEPTLEANPKIEHFAEGEIQLLSLGYSWIMAESFWCRKLAC